MALKSLDWENLQPEVYQIKVEATHIGTEAGLKTSNPVTHLTKMQTRLRVLYSENVYKLLLASCFQFCVCNVDIFEQRTVPSIGTPKEVYRRSNTQKVTCNILKVPLSRLQIGIIS